MPLAPGLGRGLAGADGVLTLHGGDSARRMPARDGGRRRTSCCSTPLGDREGAVLLPGWRFWLVLARRWPPALVWLGAPRPAGRRGRPEAGSAPDGRLT